MNPDPEVIKTILFMEDDPLDVELTLAALEEQKLTIRVAIVRDGAEGLDYLQRRGKYHLRTGPDPIVVFLDNKMPKLNGLAVLKAVKADEQLKTIPVVALTSSREATDLLEFYRHGVNAYVVKPMDPAEFRKAVRQLAAFWAGTNEPPPALPTPPLVPPDEAAPPAPGNSGQQ